MNSASTDLINQFREALTDCKRLYAQAARVALQDHGDANDETRRDMIRRMVDLHQGLLIKVFTFVAQADARLSRMERQLACELVDHIWQQRLEETQLRDVLQRMFRDAGHLQWYSLLRPFDRIAKIRSFVPELETIVMRIANLVAKSDGTVSAQETTALLAIQSEIDVHLRRIRLDEPDPLELERGTSEAIQIVHREPTLVKSRDDKGPDKPAAASSRTTPSDVDVQDSLEQALADLEQLIGLEHVKQEITTLTNYLNLQQHRQKAGLPVHHLSFHMVFQGNPGTGKTTVARIVGRIFKSLGLLQRGHLVETDRSGLVAEYAGQTAPKAHRKIDEALDGILFIDEAYSLVARGHDDAYGHEAVQALVKRIEDDRQRLVVILAGYPEPMGQLLRSNPGLGSRFNTQLLFEDYSPPELGRIYELMCKANHYELPGSARAKLLLGFQWLYASRDEHFGNGRLVRNTFENSVRRLANRVASVAPVTRELLTLLSVDDIWLPDVPDDVWSCLADRDLRFAIPCPRCEKPVHLRVEQLGRRVRCPHCQAPFQADWGECISHTA
ncbi:MAG: AAA family ATPase [Pirellulaceae bacterium]